jgi:hypothetical protein
MSRFNLRAGRVEGAYRDPVWLAERLRITARFAAPSIRSQVWPHFVWWLLCDVTTPASLLASLRDLDTRVRIALVGDEAEIEPDARRLADACFPEFGDCHRVLDATADITMSTRFDSDDCLSRDFTQSVVDRLPLFLDTGLPRFLVVAGSGYQWSDVEKYGLPFEQPTIAMQTFYERADMVAAFKGAYVGHHGRVTQMFPGFADMSRRSWLYVIHTANDSGWIRRSRQRVTADDLRDRFAAEW